MTDIKSHLIKTTQMIIDHWKNEYNKIARVTTFKERKYILEIIKDEELFIEKVKQSNATTSLELCVDGYSGDMKDYKSY